MAIGKVRIWRDRQWSIPVRNWDATKSNQIAFPDGVLTAEVRPSPGSNVLLATVAIDDSDRANGNLVLSLTAAQVAGIPKTHSRVSIDVKRTESGGVPYPLVYPFTVEIVDSVTA